MERLQGVLLLLQAVTLAVTFLVPEAHGQRFPRIDADPSEICSYIKNSVVPVCDIVIQQQYSLLFSASRLTDVVKTCNLDDTFATDINRKSLLTDLLTFISLTPHCGALVPGSDIPEPSMLGDAITQLLTWPAALPYHNCHQVSAWLDYAARNPLSYLSLGLELLKQIEELGVEGLTAVLQVLPEDLCELALPLNQFDIISSKQVTSLTDFLATNCRSGTILSNKATCSWLDRREKQEAHFNKENSTPKDDDATGFCGSRKAFCSVKNSCLQLLCKYDVKERGCDSPCSKFRKDMQCSLPCDEGSVQFGEPSITLPDPNVATPEELSRGICCLMRNWRNLRQYPDETLCKLDPPQESSCLSEFTRWQVSHASSKCECSNSSHVSALLSTECQRSELRVIPTKLDQIQNLIDSSGGRQVHLKLFLHLYETLDQPIESLLCLEPFIHTVPMREFEMLGRSRLEDILRKMCNCSDPPNAPKTLRILTDGQICPISILLYDCPQLIRVGLMTENCFDSMSGEEALKMCTIAQSDRKIQMSPHKRRLLCNVLDATGPSSCALCEHKETVGNGTSSPETRYSKRIRAQRCIALAKMDRSSLEPWQRRELESCASCMPGGIRKSWCERNSTSIDDIELELGDFCQKLSTNCEELECFVTKALPVVRQFLQSNDKSTYSYSSLHNFNIFSLGANAAADDFPCKISTSDNLCPVVRNALQRFILQLVRQHKPDATCMTSDILSAYSQLNLAPRHMMRPEDLQCMSTHEMLEALEVNSLNQQEWTQEQAKVILEKVLPVLGPTIDKLTVEDITGLGLVLVALTHEEIPHLKHIDETGFSLFGSSRSWSEDQTRALMQHYLRLSNKTASRLNADDMLVLQHLLDGLTVEQIGQIPAAVIRESTSVLSRITICGGDKLAAFAERLKQIFGPVEDWDEARCAELSYLLGGLTPDEINRMGPACVEYIPDSVWLHMFDKNTYQDFSEEIKEVMSQRQVELLKQSADCKVAPILPPPDNAGQEFSSSTTVITSSVQTEGTETKQVSGAGTLFVSMVVFFTSMAPLLRLLI